MSRGSYVVGGVGMIMLAVAALGYFIMEWVYDNTGIPGQVARAALLVLSILVGVALTLAGFGWFGVSRKTGSMLAMSSYVLALVFAWWLLVADAIRVAVYDLGIGVSPIILHTLIGGTPLRVHHVILFAAHLFLGIVFFTWGVTAIVLADKISVKGLSIAAGVLFLVAGSGYCVSFFGFVDWSVFYLQYGAIILPIAAILMAVLLFMPPDKKSA
jgi:hypothetical protein